MLWYVFMYTVCVFMKIPSLPMKGCKVKPMLSAYGHWGYFIVPHKMQHDASVFKVIYEEPRLSHLLLSDCHYTWLNDLGFMQPLKVWTPVLYKTCIAVLYMTNYFIYSWMYEKRYSFYNTWSVCISWMNWHDCQRIKILNHIDCDF